MDIKDDFKPRDYQISIMEIAIQRNTIIFLPTGSGKTLIAVMILKRLSKLLQSPYSKGGKISIMVVNTVALVEQQSKYLQMLTDYSIGRFSGDMNVDSWNREMWQNEFENNQILVMTAQILVNILVSSFLDLNKVNLIIFDECHNGVNDHAMRQVMAKFQDLEEEPRVVGLSATLLNKNCKPSDVISEVTNLENTFRSKVATVEDLKYVFGYSTNPNEEIRQYNAYNLNRIDDYAVNHFEALINVLSQIKSKNHNVTPPKHHLQPLTIENEYKDLICLINDVIYHIKNYGTYVGELAITAHTIQLEVIKKKCQDPQVATIYDAVMTTFTTVKKMFNDYMTESNPMERIYRYCSNQVLTLFKVLQENKERSQEPLCGIIFVQRRFTAKLIYNVLKKLKEVDPMFEYIEPNFVVGFNMNPFNSTREGLYKTKMNKKVLNQFHNKEINLLVSSNVLEEGVDIPTCTLVVSFDRLSNYRAYIQSKGRARHKNSYYYMIVEDLLKFNTLYSTFKEIENVLNLYLIGTNDSRDDPSQQDDEQELAPYYVNGPLSAQVNMITAIPLLCRYCLQLPSDKYTTYTPEWYLEKHKEKPLYRVVIELPTVSNILEPIEGCFMSTKKEAKRAAALKTCILLHKRGELDDELLPKKPTKVNDDLSFYFNHWPKDKEKYAGGTKKRRLHSKQIPKVCIGKLLPNVGVYLHIIELNPLFSTNNNISLDLISQLYRSETCFGFISAKPLPKLCKFSLYVTAGEILADIKVNYKSIILTEAELVILRSFHRLIFHDILKLLKSFLVIDNNGTVDEFLVVPIKKSFNFIDIDFDIAYNNKEIIDEKAEPSYEEKKSLEVKEENYSGKIVTPWYRPDDQVYLVVKVCMELDAFSKFPSDEFNSYKSYYKEKYNRDLVNGVQPLLLVKGLSKKLSCIRPRFNTNKRGREKVYEDIEEHLIPELCVKQEIPSALWLQAILLPSILYRLMSFLQADELRSQIALESGLGLPTLPENEEWAPLVLDRLALSFETNEVPTVRKPECVLDEELMEEDSKLPIIEIKRLCQDFAIKELNSQFPWDIEEEPIDIERNIDVTLMDVQYFENFISQNAKIYEPTKIVNRSPLAAITFDRSYIYKDIELLTPDVTNKGPELIDILTALTTAKSRDLVSLERLETLGDSFLKLSVSLFVSLRYPHFDEGKLTTLKGKLISNKNLYYIGKNKNIPGYLRTSDFAPGLEWKPPSFCVPKLLMDRIKKKEVSVHSLFNFMFVNDEKISGELNDTSIAKIMETEDEIEEEQEEVGYDSMHSFLDLQIVSDKTVADSVEALLGVYFQFYGFEGGLTLLKWLEIIPPFENIDKLMSMKLPNPVLNKDVSSINIDYHLPDWKKVEEKLNYTFKNRAYLLQALTHSSYTPNRITNCYQRLEFLGDAVLDFLITCHIYETCGNLSPGDLTDLRSALVNNITFASFTVRCGFQKHLLFSNNQLLKYINNFVEHQESKNHKINEEVLILLEETDLYIAEHVDVPKVLGDTFEALAGAIFLDSGMCLKTVWKVFHRIMWQEIELFKNNVPKNAVRLIHETVGAHPEFDKAKITDTGHTLVGLKFMLNGAKKKVYGFGENKALAKKAAAKFALRLLYKN